MIIDIKNLGYVKNAKINLGKDLIIFCGPNNTGKTYVAYAIYGLMKHRSMHSKIKRINDLILSLPEEGEIELDLVEILTTNGKQHLNSVAKDYVKQLSRVFASSDKIFSDTQITAEFGDLTVLRSKILEENISSEISFADNSLTARIIKEKGSSILRCILIKDKKQSSRKEMPVSILTDILADQVSRIYLSFFFSKPYISPAERIAINLFSKEISLKRNVLVDKLLDLKSEGNDDDPFDLVRRRATRYPLPIRDSLEIAEDLNNFKKNTTAFNSFADEIEADILKGKVAVSKEGEVQFKPDKGRVILPIHLSASAVKSLSSLVIYFRHLASENDFIIIDEPEMNLHPDNQVIIARIIAKIVNKGFKVLVNTHSDYIIRELNNLIMLSRSQNIEIDFDYETNEMLKPEQVEALLFRYETRKVESLNVDETGFEVETIDKVINELNTRSQELYFAAE